MPATDNAVQPTAMHDSSLFQVSVSGIPLPQQSLDTLFPLLYQLVFTHECPHAVVTCVRTAGAGNTIATGCSSNDKNCGLPTHITISASLSYWWIVNSLSRGAHVPEPDAVAAILCAVDLTKCWCCRSGSSTKAIVQEEC